MAAAVTLLRLPLARLSYHLRSVPSFRLPPARLRIFTSHRLFSSLDHGSASASASATVAEVVGVPDAEKESVEEESAAEIEAEAEAPRSFVLPRLPRPKLSVKERKELASYAHGLGKKLKSQQVGKSGVTPNLVSAFSDNLESNELLKLKIHGNCPAELPDVILQLEESTGSISVDQIGRSVILYRPSTSKMKRSNKLLKMQGDFQDLKKEVLGGLSNLKNHLKNALETALAEDLLDLDLHFGVNRREDQWHLRGLHMAEGSSGIKRYILVFPVIWTPDPGVIM